MKKRQRGFTLVELVVVIAIIAILTAVLVPTFASVAKSAQRAADVSLMRIINTKLIADEIDEAELKEHKLQTKGWELAYSVTEKLTVIVDEDGIIVAAWSSKLIGSSADEEGYVRISEIEGAIGGGNGGNTGDNSDVDHDENKDKRWQNAIVVSALPEGEEEKAELLQNSEIYLDDSVDFIPDSYFKDSAITRIHIGSKITEIPKSAFNGCADLTEVEIAGTVTTVGDKAFSGCTALKSLQLPDIATLGNYVFNDCDFDLLSVHCFDITNVAVEFTVRQLMITGGETTVEFGNWVYNIIEKHKDELTITITNTAIVSDLFKSAKSNVTIYIDEFSYNSLKENNRGKADSELFGKADVVKLWESL